MSESYVECLIKAKTPMQYVFLKYFTFLMTAASGVLALLTQNLILFLVAIAFGVGAYFANLFSVIEYEYLYMDKELTIDRILGRDRRKTMAVYKLESIEIFAPIRSYHLDNFGKRENKVKDFSIGYEDKPDRRYALYLEGGEKLILSPSEDLVKIMKNAAPRKVFND